MNRMTLALSALAVLAAGSLAAQPASAPGHGARQYYGDWHKSTSGYAYRAYYYKPTPQYGGYHHHYVIHHPDYPEHNYYYSPYTKKYWGRCPARYGDQPVYSLLAEKDRHGNLAQIPESAFPKPGPVPAIPESKDGVRLDLPPDDLPPGELPGDLPGPAIKN